MHLCLTVRVGGGGSKEAHMRLQAGAAAGKRDRKLEKQLKRNCVGSMRGINLCIWVGSTCSDRETGRKANCRREQLGSENTWTWRMN